MFTIYKEKYRCQRVFDDAIRLLEQGGEILKKARVYHTAGECLYITNSSSRGRYRHYKCVRPGSSLLKFYANVRSLFDYFNSSDVFY